MDAVIEEFEDRVAEVDQFLEVLKRLENPAIVLRNRSTGRNLRVLQDGSFKVMKATVFLLIYNVVESAIRTGFVCLYEEIESRGGTCADVSKDVRAVWIRQSFQLDEDSASQKNYRELVEKLVEQVLEHSTLSFSKKRLPVSGTLDADGIRKVCRLHGVRVHLHPRASGGRVLETVKAQRNALAHGDTSFSDCGRDYAVRDLKRIKQQAFVFVRSILRNLRRYVHDQDYLDGQ